MEFSRLREPIQKIGPGKYAIGDNPLEPQLTLDNEKVHVPVTLTISGINFLDYLSGSPDVIRYQLQEGFETNLEGDLMPSEAQYIADPMWILRNENDLELRTNHWVHNYGSDSFTDEISF